MLFPPLECPSQEKRKPSVPPSLALCSASASPLHSLPRCKLRSFAAVPCHMLCCPFCRCTLPRPVRPAPLFYPFYPLPSESPSLRTSSTAYSPAACQHALAFHCTASAHRPMPHPLRRTNPVGKKQPPPAGTPICTCTNCSSTYITHVTGSTHFCEESAEAW